MMWYEKVGFSSNPFSIKPAAFHDEIIGQNLRLVMDRVEEGGLVFIKGEYGTGKTSVLKRIINRYRGKGKLIYLNLEFAENVRVRDLLRKRAGTLQRLFNTLPDDVVLLVDEAQLMTREFSEDIHDHFEKGFIRSVVFVGTDFNKKQFSQEILKGLNDNVISLKSITPQQAIMLVRMRTGDILLSDKIISEIFSYSNNPRQFLENCEDVCKYVVDIYSTQADSDHVNTVLGKKTKERKERRVRREKKARREAVEEKVEKKKEEKAEIEEGTEREKKEEDVIVKEPEREPKRAIKKSAGPKKTEKVEKPKKAEKKEKKKEHKKEPKKELSEEEEKKEYLEDEEKKKPLNKETTKYYIDNPDEYPEYSFKQEEEEKDEL